MRPDILGHRFFSLSLIQKMMAIIIIGLSFYSCATLNSPNYQARIKAVNNLTDQNVLYKVALEDISYEVKIAALNKISDQNIISRLIFESYEPNLCLEALNKITDQNILYKLSMEGSNLNLRIAATNKITDQKLINSLVAESKDYKLRSELINKISDQSTLYTIALNDLSYNVKLAAFNKITDQNLINKLATESKERNLILEAVVKVSDQNTLYKIASENDDYYIRSEALNRINQSYLAKLAVESEELSLRLKVSDMLTNQTELLYVTQNASDPTIREEAFNKLNNNSLDILTREAKDPVLVFSAKIRLERIHWKEVFSGKNSSTIYLGNALKAALLVDEPRPAQYDVIYACNKFIELGDSSIISVMDGLLFKFGNISMAEDYINSGNGYLESSGRSWAYNNGYTVTSGSGSSRSSWGSKK